MHFFYHYLHKGKPPPHLESLYLARSIDTFERDLAFIAKKQLKQKATILSFDDGLTTCFQETVDLLKKYQLNACFFLIKNTLDNQALTRDHLSALIAHHIKTNKPALSPPDIDSNQMTQALVQQIKKLPDAELGPLCQSIKLDVQNYLINEKPYLDSEQVQYLINEGFIIGAHSCTHPNFSNLSLKEQIKETIESVDFLKKRFGLKKMPFAFPYLRVPENPEYFHEMNKYGEVSQFFGQHGLTWDKSLPFTPRITVEGNNAHQSIQDILKVEKQKWVQKKWKTTKRFIRAKVDEVQEASAYKKKTARIKDSKHPPILVYQMGKVGSLTTVATLENTSLKNEIVHTHSLSDTSIKRLRQEGERQGKSLSYDERFIQTLREHIDDTMHSQDWRIITHTREPVAMEISGIFQNLNRLYKHVFNPDGSIQNEVLIQTCLERLDSLKDPQHNYFAHWFDRELKGVFDINVYESDYSFEQGYSILTKDNISVLIVRLEDFKRSLAKALSEFLSINISEVVSTNTAGRRDYAQEYQYVLHNISIPQETLENIYASQYAQHFYKDEIPQLIEKWSHPEARLQKSS